MPLPVPLTPSLLEQFNEAPIIKEAVSSYESSVEPNGEHATPPPLFVCGEIDTPNASDSQHHAPSVTSPSFVQRDQPQSVSVGQQYALDLLKQKKPLGQHRGVAPPPHSTGASPEQPLNSRAAQPPEESQLVAEHRPRYRNQARV
ncbi:hypothetical protein VMCG_00095 [Cytospora schulzeri]|uniref:Uncharacterized protein n=1 Tax=Cytospora schulzeri TaxID=448051 RepID=A0A423X9K9_9PEZI|nr:hypothetical protein VMCG_00095 [Valsa malicola]